MNPPQKRKKEGIFLIRLQEETARRQQPLLPPLGCRRLGVQARCCCCRAYCNMVAERPIDADAALALLAPDEKARVRDFVLGAPEDRELLSGSAPIHTFLDCFVCWSGDSNRALLAEGRSLRQVVSVIRRLGGMQAAALRVPWLLSAVSLSEALSFARLARGARIFARHATAAEAVSLTFAAASPCEESARYSIEEGQHRAIAAAWVLTGGGESEPNASLPRRVPYLRGVNLRKGAVEGGDFWRLGPAGSAALGGSGVMLPCAGLLLATCLCRWRVRGKSRAKRAS